MNIRKEYKELLHKIIKACEEIDMTQSNNLLKIVNVTRLKGKFNCIDFWNNFIPNADKPYSILNTESSNEGRGVHWIGVFQEENVIYLYDSFARKHIMDDFCDKMERSGYRCTYVNKKGDQGNLQINCGIRSLLWLLFVERYGIRQASKI
jgi:hypothetical protein